MSTIRSELTTYVVYRRLQSGSRERLNTIVAESEDDAIERATNRHGAFIEIKEL